MGEEQASRTAKAGRRTIKRKSASEPGSRVIVLGGGEGPSLKAATWRYRDVKKDDVSTDGMLPEELFKGVVIGNQAGVISPPVDFDVACDMVQNNNILPSLIDVMETNVDGTGADIAARPMLEARAAGTDVAADEKAQLETERKRLQIEQFFEEPVPGKSFTTIRRALRRWQEKIGNAYLEVMRNVKGELVFVDELQAKNVRLVRLDEPVSVRKKVFRGGREVEIEFKRRERRYVQAVGSRVVWFKEFGASRDLNKKDGTWAEKGALPFEDRANEVIHFKLRDDPFSPYGLPRWWSCSPSAVGSRRAEEFNLAFFDTGGVPPMMVVVSGGALAEEAERALREHFESGNTTSRHTALILEAYSTEGDMEHPANVKVTVERFGSDRAKDSMFEGYIEKCDLRLKRAYRVPSIFLGESNDYNLATAIASIMVAEGQVFRLERQEFDEKINLLLMPELPNGMAFEYKSKPAAFKDAQTLLQGVGLVADKLEAKELLRVVGDAVGVEFAYDEAAAAQPAQEGGAQAVGGKPGASPLQAGQQEPSAAPAELPAGASSVRKASAGITSLAQRAADQLRIGLATDADYVEWAEIRRKVETMDPTQRQAFRALVSLELMPDSDDPGYADEAVDATLDVNRRAAGA